MLLEVEKAIAKQKFSDQDQLEDKLDQDISEEVNLEEKQRIDEIVRRETARMKMTYNKENKILDPGNLKATEFKFNRHMAVHPRKKPYLKLGGNKLSKRSTSSVAP